MSPLGRVLPASVLVVGMGLLYPMQRWIDKTSPRASVSEETLFLSSGKSIKKMSLGLDGLAADIYWIRTVQYFGRKLIESDKPLSAGATKDIRMDLLAPLLNIVVTLDPQHVPAYRFGAIFLPERDLPAAIALVEKGISENPNEWRLYQDLGYIYWQAGNASAGEERADIGADHWRRPFGPLRCWRWRRAWPRWFVQTSTFVRRRPPRWISGTLLNSGSMIRWCGKPIPSKSSGDWDSVGNSLNGSNRRRPFRSQKETLMCCARRSRSALGMLSALSRSSWSILHCRSWTSC